MSAKLDLANTVELVLFRLWVTGFSLGVLSHLILDSLTTAGIHIIPGMKFRLVPKSSAFATGGKWELFIQKLLYVLIGIVILVILKNNIMV